MKSLVRSCLLLPGLFAPWSQAAAPDPSLVGCWRAVKIVLHAQDGSKTEDTSGRCTLQFKEQQFESTCGTTNGKLTTTYQYQVVRPHVYSATMTASTFRTDLIGSKREYEYRVEGDRLVTATNPPARVPASSPAAPRVESESVRAPCP
jgi:hypothetical protein